MKQAALIAALTAFGATAKAQTGFLDRVVSTGGHQYRYQIYVPADYTPTTAWPVIVSLHGNGRQGTDGIRQTGTDFAVRIRENGGPFPALVVFPQAQPGTRWFYPEMEALIMAELRQTINDFRVDTTRLYLHGYSMGGTGSYRLAFHQPNTFAALVVVAGRVEDGPNYTPSEIDIDRRANSFLGASDPFTTLAGGLKHLPIWIAHGDADTTVNVAQSRRLVAALKLAGSQVRYIEYAGADHLNVTARTYADTALFSWLFGQHR
jgi:predicted peptidase